MENIYLKMSAAELFAEKDKLTKKLEEYRKEGLKLDISRGKPNKAQLDLSMPMLDLLYEGMDVYSENGMDTRNYGALTGLPEAKRLMADVMETKPENVIIFCDSSLNIMYDLISKAFTHGICGEEPWFKQGKIKFLCPVPGYDRHFGITENFGVEMINIPMLADGPDMDLVEKYVNNDPAVKGIWCVPKYSNPTGTVYSDEVCNRFAHLKPAAKDFRIFWDNAYNVHHFDFDHIHTIPEILELCEKAGNPDIVYKLGSFSKITFSGSSIAALATSVRNILDVTSQMSVQTIGHNKINQLLHARFFKNHNDVLEHMKKHAAILKPKFDAVQKALEEGIGDSGIGEWTKPDGGYFVSFNTLPGCAKEVVDLMKVLGVAMTEAGATFPYHKDPTDQNIRIAPSYATLDEIEKALKIFTDVVRFVAVERALGEEGNSLLRE